MRILKLVLSCLIIVGGGFATAGSSSKKTARKPNQIESSQISFKVTYGEKATAFVLSQQKKGPQIELTNSQGRHDIREITQKDADYIRSQVLALSGPSNQIEFCTRNYIEVKVEARDLIGCLGSPNKLAQGLKDITNLISLLF